MKPQHIALTASTVLLVVALLAGIWGSRRQPLGVYEGRLLSCPASPNCVSSLEQSGVGEHTMAAITYTGSPEEALGAVKQVLAELPRTTLLTQKDTYMRFAVRSARLGFIDDVEFLITDGAIHFRSASRLGYDDLGVNRTRMTLIGQRLRERLAAGA